MAFKLASRTREQTTTTGTGTIQLGGLLHPTERLFIDAIGDGNQTSYVILSGDGTSVEEGIGSVAAGSPPTLARRVLRSTNGDALVALTGTSTVYCADVPNLTPAAGPTWHAAIAVATTGALPACTYANGVAGRGATLTASANGALTIDGVALIAGFRVLVKDQVAPAQNGIYLTTQPGAAGAPFVLTRALDYDDEVEIYEGDCVAVGAAGQSNGRTLWTMFTAAASIVVGTSDINWSLIGIRNSEGLDLIGSTPGDMLVRGATDWIALAPGPDGDVLTMAGGAPAWGAAASKYIIACSTAGAPTAGQAMLYHRFPAAASFAANFGPIPGHASQAGGTVNATAATVMNVDKAAAATPNTFTTVGTITFAAGTVTPTFATTGGAAVTFAQGDVLRIVAPATPDATFAGFYCSLVGVEI